MGTHDLYRRIHERSAAETGPAFRQGDCRVAMAYPSPYRAGMSSLGFQWITRILRDEGISAERAFLPDEPEAWRKQRCAPITYETGSPLSRFPLIAVSLAYELEIAGLIELLELSGIPPLRKDRRPNDPLVILGGPISMANPLPAAPFVDAMLLGEAEDTAPAAVTAFFGSESRAEWLDVVQDLAGGFVPERDGHVLPPIAKASDARLPAHSSWLCPDAELSNMFLIEGERGCHRQCTFCVMRRSTNGGMRLVTPDRILSLVPDQARKVGLVGAAISDHPQLVDILDSLVSSGRQVSVSSLRADRVRVRPRIAELLKQSGARTLTVASDAASQRLRRTISKGTTEKHLDACADLASSLQFSTLKVYMMVGLPDEEEKDIDELIHYSLALAKRAAPTRLALGIAPFVAKRNTPLDGIPFAGIKVVDKRLKQLKRGLRGQVEVRPTSARWAWVEYEMSQRGAEAGLAVYEAWKNGGRFAHYRDALQRLDAQSRRPWISHGPMVA